MNDSQPLQPNEPAGADTTDEPSNACDPFPVSNHKGERGHFPSGTPYEIINRQQGATIYFVDNSYVLKAGHRVKMAEKVAMDMVYEQGGIPIGPAWFYDKNNGFGNLNMEYVEGITLEEAWPSLSPETKKGLCVQTWAIVRRLRAIPRPKDHPPGACAADGTWPEDVLFGFSEQTDTSISLRTDLEIRTHIGNLYRSNFGRKYTAEQIVQMFPSSSEFVFTHGDLAPRNIMVKETDGVWNIEGILDWENAGFYPDYWEYINIWRPVFKELRDWRGLMEETAPREFKCALEGVLEFRKIVF